MSRTIFPEIIGNSVIKNYIGKDIISGNNSHAYIIEGPEGSGKRSTAKAIAASLACQERTSDSFSLPCGTCDNCHRIYGDISGDVVWITSGDKASIGVEEIRNIKNGLYVTPNDSDFRTYIIVNAERMTVQAQNALLLTLEEPPSFVVFLLLTEDATKLLETVRSRAQCFRMEKFTVDAVAEYLQSSYEGKRIKNSFPEKFAGVVALSDGSLGRAKEMLSGSEETSDLLRFRSLANEFVPLACRGKIASMIKMGLPKVFSGNQEAKIFLQIVDNAVRDMIVSKRSDSVSTLFYVSHDDTVAIGSEASLKKLFHIHSELLRAIARLDSNSSVKTVFTDMYMKIAAYKR